MDTLNDKLSIKNLLFTKALPNYVIPVPVNGHKIYPCTDCGDKFVFESSFNDHVNRKSVKITYMCRYCNESRTFFNRCNLLFHIRSHVFKTATINVTDLKVEPLPICNLKYVLPSPTNTTASADETSKPTRNCLDCQANISITGIMYKDRANHYMQYSSEVYSCPVCLFALPNICAVKTHLRLHLRCPPYYCIECGSSLSTKNVNYPYNHDCEGFKMMRATARLKCVGSECRLFHPNDYKEHMKENHMKKVHKCPHCVVACFSEVSIMKHLKDHKTETKPLIFYKCELCSGKFILQTRMESHLKSHKVVSVFPCWPCSVIFKDVSDLLYHFKEQHKNERINAALTDILSEYESNPNKPKRAYYRVLKRCDQCNRSFTYRCLYSEIHNLPNECPYKCSSTMESNVMPDKIQNNTNITCHLCKANISQEWNEIKKHYAALHKTFRCLEPKLMIERMDLKKYLPRHNISTARTSIKTISKKRSRKSKKLPYHFSTVSISTENVKVPSSDNPKVDDDSNVCKICGKNYGQKQILEKHMISHRDPCMAYQCMECGQSFVVKPSFSKHLLLEHDITDTEDYITRKQCYNESALVKYQTNTNTSDEPLRENQCTICREAFNGPEDLEKHFRVHGMAFLMKNTSKTPIS